MFANDAGAMSIPSMRYPIHILIRKAGNGRRGKGKRKRTFRGINTESTGTKGQEVIQMLSESRTDFLRFSVEAEGKVQRLDMRNGKDRPRRT